MKNMIKDMVSIIIPIFNVEDYLEECIESVLNQTYDNYEVILVNDGSTDRSGEISKKYSEKFNNIYLINQDNKGVAEARNIGIKHSRGEYLYFLDSDDMIQNNMLEVCMNKFKENDIDIVFLGYMLFEGNKILEKNLMKSDKCILTGKEFLKYSSKMMLGRNFQMWDYVFKKELWIKNNISFKKGLIFEDTHAYIDIFMKNVNVAIIDEYLYLYRNRKESITRKKSYSKYYLDCMNAVINNYYSYINEDEELNEVILQYIKIFYNEKYRILLKLDEFTEELIIEEIRDIIIKSKKLEVFFCGLYIEKLKEVCIKNKFSLDYFDEDYINVKAKELEEIRYKKISEIEFNDKNKKIGIYGVGYHTEGLLKYYEKAVGKVKSNVILIDSFKESGNDSITGLPIINVRDIEKYNFDCIVLSSVYSEEVLLGNLSGYRGRIKRLYDDNNVILFG